MMVIYICKFCYKEFTHLIRLDFHELYQCEENKTAKDCNICKARFRTEKERSLHYYEIHLSSNHQFENHHEEPNENSKVDEQIRNETITQERKKGNMKIEIKKQNKWKNSVDINQPEDNRQEVNKSFRIPHICVLCKTSLSSLVKYVHHYNLEHGVPIQPNHECNECKSKSKNRFHHLDHVIQKHTNFKPFQCLGCNTYFKCRTNLRKKRCKNCRSHEEEMEESILRSPSWQSSF